MSMKLFNELESMVSSILYPNYEVGYGVFNMEDLYSLSNKNSTSIKTYTNPVLKNQYIVSSGENGLTYEFNLAGFSKEQISVSYKKSDQNYYAGTFSVKAEVPKDGNIPKSLKNFSYANTVAYGYDLTKMQSSFSNGLLTVQIPVMEQKEKKVEEVKIKIL